jgi:protein-S-isoprenylcysteine O-methyltransferase Ste14
MRRNSFIERLRIPLSRACLAAVAFLILFSDSAWDERHPMMGVSLFMVGAILVAFGSMGRLWCAVYIAGYKTHKLVTDGPYSISRNPLYFFSLIGGFGTGLATETMTIPLLVLLAFRLYYPFVIRSEEKKLREVHGEAFDAYCATVPQLFPKWKLLREPETYSVNPRVFRKHIASALWFVWILGICEVIEGLHETGLVPHWISLF